MSWFFVILGIVIALGVLLIFFRGKKSVSASEAAKIQKHWKSVLAIDDPARQVLEADKVLDQLLGALGYSGTTGEKLKKASAILPNEQSLWSAHKLRNRIAHEPGIHVSEKEALKALKAFEALLRKYVR